MGTLSGLQHLNLTANHIGGSLPSEIGSMPNLKVLHLANNLMGGSIPHSMGSLKKLKDLDLSRNEFKGTVPYEMGELTDLTSLKLGECVHFSFICVDELYFVTMLNDSKSTKWEHQKLTFLLLTAIFPFQILS